MTPGHHAGFILIVDDNPTNLSVLSELLRRVGLSFRVAMDGESALDITQRSHPQLILLDIRMPGIDGFETCRRLKNNPLTQAIPVIFTTAAADTHSKTTGFSLGAVDYITKPFQKEEVLARINVHLRLHHLNQTLEHELVLRRQTEQKLRQSEKRYRSLYENTPVMLHSIDADGTLISVSNYWLQRLGYERSEVLGQPLTMFLSEVPHHHTPEIGLNDYLQTGIGADIPYQVVCKTGEMIDVLLSAIAETDSSGHLIRSLAVMIDVTERNRAHATLLQTEKLVALGRLIAGIAHELRNPLNFVKNFAEGSIELSQDLRDELKNAEISVDADTSDSIQALISDLQQNAAIICHHSQRTSQIIDSMMQHDHPDHGQVESQPIDLHQLLDRAVKLAFHSKQLDDNTFTIEVNTDYTTQIKPILGISSSLIRAFINIIDNACDAMRLKQRQLRAADSGSCYVPSLSITSSQLNNHVLIRIQDNGCGIPPNIQPQVFDPFFTTKSPGEGTGLGLSITHDIIVKQHHGRLKVNTEPSEFTEFILTLPNR